MSVRATLAGVPVKMARETADSGGFPANAAVVVAVAAPVGWGRGMVALLGPPGWTCGSYAGGASKVSGGCGRGGMACRRF